MDERWEKDYIQSTILLIFELRGYIDENDSNKLKDNYD